MPHSPDHLHDGADAARSGWPTGQRPEPLATRMKDAILKKVPSLHTWNSVMHAETKHNQNLMKQGATYDQLSRWPLTRDDAPSRRKPKPKSDGSDGWV